ncbi:MAG: sigma-54-dependent Fis family transcriptional regulator [Bacteroidetes bacterium]|nr:sigma-54-dependent Fis family transcriptional regulator [Bacteroidota bacterium]
MNNIGFKIALVDDENIHRITLADELKDAGYTVYEFSLASAVLLKIEEIQPDVVITDLKMPEMDGIELLTRVKQFNQDIPVILMTAYASLQTALEAMKKGAYDYLSKPFEADELILMLERLKEIGEIKSDNKRLRKQLHAKYDFSSFIGSSEAIRRVFELVKIVSNTDTTVSISGETGTGKELLANIIHYNSSRQNKPHIKVSCAILSKDIFESELFGHEKGAFTGAENQKIGRFELANEGTIYLDDIDDMPLDLQVKILRVLEESEIERVGGSKTIKIDVRVIVSTKVDLKKLVDEGKFREDLYYRLNVFPIKLEPLRNKRNDIPYIFKHFLKEFSDGREIGVEKDVFNILKDYPWFGNVRELRNIAERLTLLAENDLIKTTMVPVEIEQAPGSSILNHIGDKPLIEATHEFEISAIKIALNKFAGNRTRAAKYLGLPPSTLHTKMSKYDIK